MTTRIEDEEYPIEHDMPSMVRGSDWIGFAFQIMEDDNVTPKNTTGYDAEMIITEEGWNAATPYATLTVGSGITHTASQGLFNFSIAKATIDTFDWRTAVYKINITDSGGGITPYFMGRMFIKG